MSNHFIYSASKSYIAHDAFASEAHSTRDSISRLSANVVESENSRYLYTTRHSVYKWFTALPPSLRVYPIIDAWLAGRRRWHNQHILPNHHHHHHLLDFIFTRSKALWAKCCRPRPRIIIRAAVFARFLINPTWGNPRAVVRCLLGTYIFWNSIKYRETRVNNQSITSC